MYPANGGSGDRQKVGVERASSLPLRLYPWSSLDWGVAEGRAQDPAQKDSDLLERTASGKISPFS